MFLALGIISIHHFVPNKIKLLTISIITLIGCVFGANNFFIPFGAGLALVYIQFFLGVGITTFLLDLLFKKFVTNWILQIIILVLFVAIFYFIFSDIYKDYSVYSEVQEKNLFSSNQNSINEILNRNISAKQKVQELNELMEQFKEECSILNEQDRARCLDLASFVDAKVKIGFDNKGDERDPTIPSLLCNDGLWRYTGANTEQERIDSCYIEIAITSLDCDKITDVGKKQYCYDKILGD